jgi:hypothetical protein
MKTTQKGISLSRVLDQIDFCAAGCGTRTRTGVCAECARYDPEVCRQRRTEEKNRQIRALGALWWGCAWHMPELRELAGSLPDGDP